MVTSLVSYQDRVMMIKGMGTSKGQMNQPASM